MRWLLLVIVLACLSCTTAGKEKTLPPSPPQPEKVEPAPEEKPAEQGKQKPDIRKVLDSLIEQLADAEFKVRQNAHKEIESILKERIETPKELERLVSFLKERLSEAEDAEVRIRLERILGFYSIYIDWGITPEVLSKFPDVVERLTSSDVWVRREIVEELGEWGEPASVTPLIGMLGDVESGVRVDAAIALGEIGDERAVQPLIEALRDADEDIREFAASVLRKLTRQDFNTDYEKWLDWFKKRR